MTPDLLATRVRKARRPGWCRVCNGPVRIGQQIGYWPAFPGWLHVQCGLALVREAKGAA